MRHDAADDQPLDTRHRSARTDRAIRRRLACRHPRRRTSREAVAALNRTRSRRTVTVHHAIRAGIGADSVALARATGESASRLIEMRDVHGPADLAATAPVGTAGVHRLAELLGEHHSVWVEWRGATVALVVRIDHTAPIAAEASRLIERLGDDPTVVVQVASWSVSAGEPTTASSAPGNVSPLLTGTSGLDAGTYHGGSGGASKRY